MDYNSLDAVLHYIFRSALGDTWFQHSEESIFADVCLRSEPSQFRFFPHENPYLAPFEATTATVVVAETEKDRSFAAASLPTKKLWGGGWNSSSKKAHSNASNTKKDFDNWKIRPIRLYAPFYSLLGAGLSLFIVSNGLMVLLQNWKWDRDYGKCFAVLALSPFLFAISLFFSMQIITTIAMMCGPVGQYQENSRYYSAVKPEPNAEVDMHLPHVTIEMPIYKESLEDTIAPSVLSIKKAMQTYAIQGGTSAIFVHDDGLQTLSTDEQQKRITFYSDHNIGWIARPPHSNKPDGFKRAGHFKKASNMNYGLQLALSMEKIIHALEDSAESFNTEISLEDKALELAIEEAYEATGRKWKPWAENAHSLRVGDIILIVDSDTIVPEDCFRDAVREFAVSPEVAIIQHESDVIQVAHHFFENGIAHFTRRINKCISLSSANGDIAPFVGHNAFLRWSAIQNAAMFDENGVQKIWSENNVSEDFDMALRLQLKGYIVRWANYSNGGFKEGVSLTVDDELNRWRKYAYGCNELIFHPLKDWWRFGPITKQFRTFLGSSTPAHYKLATMAYMFSYYGIAASAFLSLLNYIHLGSSLEAGGRYMHSFEIWLACTLVLPGASNLAYTLLEFRLGQRDMFSSFVENFMYIPFFIFFFGGLSIHISTAILAHFFSYNITWSATKKEVEKSNFWKEVPRIAKRYWFVLTLGFLTISAMIMLSTTIVPTAWRIPESSWAVVLPLGIMTSGHILFPIVLNPWFLVFSS